MIRNSPFIHSKGDLIIYCIERGQVRGEAVLLLIAFPYTWAKCCPELILFIKEACDKKLPTTTLHTLLKFLIL
ncbi:MAG: hypothetical protein AAFU64_17080, partial [Bacteroidota bacterium]